jgi:hypothetical protein
LGLITNTLLYIVYNENIVEMISKKVVVATTLIAIAFALTVAPSTSWWGFNGNQEAKGQVKSITGSGTGTHTCPSGVQKTSSISFGASGTGTWSIPGKAGRITSVQHDGSTYTATGSETLNVLCLRAIPLIAPSISITGTCGTGKTINFEASNGEKGTFTGNVSCR